RTGVVQVHYDEGIANRIGPEPCAGIREDVGEASAGERAGQPLSRDRKLIPGADAVCVAEGNMSKSANASAWATRRGRGGGDGAKGGDQGKRGSAKHAPDADPGSRAPGAGPRTASRSALRRQTPKVGAGCSNRARPDLCGGVLSNEHPY